MKIVFNSFRAISTTIGLEECQHYAFQMLLPLYKVSEGFAGKVISGEVHNSVVFWTIINLSQQTPLLELNNYKIAMIKSNLIAWCFPGYLLCST